MALYANPDMADFMQYLGLVSLGLPDQYFVEMLEPVTLNNTNTFTNVTGDN
jgi:hypothetical protein